jgi:hypothetical protein
VNKRNRTSLGLHIIYLKVMVTACSNVLRLRLPRKVGAYHSFCDWVRATYLETEVFQEHKRLFLFKMVSHYVVRTNYVVHADFDFTILLPQLPECWNYSHMPSCPAKSDSY